MFSDLDVDEEVDVAVDVDVDVDVRGVKSKGALASSCALQDLTVWVEPKWFVCAPGLSLSQLSYYILLGFLSLSLSLSFPTLYLLSITLPISIFSSISFPHSIAFSSSPHSLIVLLKPHSCFLVVMRKPL